MVAPPRWGPFVSAAGMAVRREALIVASYAYEDAGLCELRAPAHDAEALAGVLGDPDIGGFTVRVLLNEPAHVINETLEEFFADRRHDDVLLLHFSGHGVKAEDGELYLAAANTKLKRLAATAVAADFVNRQMSRSRSRRIVLLLDCCYAGAFARGLTPRSGTSVGLEPLLGGRGRAVITASSAMEYAFEGGVLAGQAPVTPAVRPSVFTGALVDGLATGAADRDGDGLVGLDELYDHVYDRVRDLTPNQTPGKWTFDMQGNLYIARRADPTGRLADGGSRPAARVQIGPAVPPPLAVESRPRASRLLSASRRKWIAGAAGLGLASIAAVVALNAEPRDDPQTSVSPPTSQASAPRPAGPVIFRDDFNTRRSGWPHTTGTGRYGGYYADGAYRFWNQETNKTWWATPRKANAIYPAAPANIRVEARARWSLPNDGAWFGISCRTVKLNDAYLFNVAEGVGHIVKMKGRVYDELAGAPVAGIDLHEYTTLQAECRTIDRKNAVRLTFRINGKTVVEYTDRAEPIPTGTVGTVVELASFAANAEVEFDDFVVTRL